MAHLCLIFNSLSLLGFGCPTFDIHDVQYADCCSSISLAGSVDRCCVGGGGGGGEGIVGGDGGCIYDVSVERLCIHVNGYFKVSQGLETFNSYVRAIILNYY